MKWLALIPLLFLAATPARAVEQELTADGHTCLSLGQAGIVEQDCDLSLENLHIWKSASVQDLVFLSLTHDGQCLNNSFADDDCNDDKPEAHWQMTNDDPALISPYGDAKHCLAWRNAVLTLRDCGANGTWWEVRW
jgi:hypothetical protein